jgi:hypothetical protein
LTGSGFLIQAYCAALAVVGANLMFRHYAWQEKNQKIKVKSQKSKRLNVLGFLTRQNQPEAYTFQCSINTDVVIACIDRWFYYSKFHTCQISNDRYRQWVHYLGKIQCDRNEL